MKAMLNSIHFILHPSAFILTSTPSLTVGLPSHRLSDSSMNSAGMFWDTRL